MKTSELKLKDNLKAELLSGTKYSLGSDLYHYHNVVSGKYVEESKYVSGVGIIKRIANSTSKEKLSDKLIALISSNLTNEKVVYMAQCSNWL